MCEVAVNAVNQVIWTLWIMYQGKL